MRASANYTVLGRIRFQFYIKYSIYNIWYAIPESKISGCICRTL